MCLKSLCFNLYYYYRPINFRFRFSSTDDDIEEKLNEIRISGIKAKFASQQTTASEENEY
jgi:hypothetical protein